MAKHLLVQAHIAKLNKLIESEVTELTSSIVNETALAILKRQGSRLITIESLQRKFIYDIQVDPYWPKWQTKRSKLGAKNFENSESCQDTCDHYLMSGLGSSLIPRDTISNLKLRWSYKAFRYDLVVPSTTTLGHICKREYALTVDAMKKQLLSRNQVS